MTHLLIASSTISDNIKRCERGIEKNIGWKVIRNDFEAELKFWQKLKKLGTKITIH